MDKISVKAYGKINLSLDITGKRADGYHTVLMVMQSINLYDVLEFEISDKIELVCGNKNVPQGEQNLVVKAAKLLKERYGGSGTRITLNKNIPMAAGLAGGSADAAATLAALNRLWNLNLNNDILREIAVKLGADVPFCLEGGTKIAKGIGEVLKNIKTHELELLLVKPDIEVSTKEIYEGYDSLNLGFNKNYTKRIIEALTKGSLYDIAENLGNVLEEVTISKYPVVKKIKLEMLKRGAIGSLMSGSGPTVYGIFDDESKLKNAYKIFCSEYESVYYAKTIDKGIEFV